MLRLLSHSCPGRVVLMILIDLVLKVMLASLQNCQFVTDTLKERIILRQVTNCLVDGTLRTMIDIWGVSKWRHSRISWSEVARVQISGCIERPWFLYNCHWDRVQIERNFGATILILSLIRGYWMRLIWWEIVCSWLSSRVILSTLILLSLVRLILWQTNSSLWKFFWSCIALIQILVLSISHL